jgi:hypothetical protein
MTPRSRGASGSVAVWTVLWLAVLIAFLALVINVGHLMTARGELQNGVDAAALAGALQLRGTAEELAPARAAATGYAAAHPTDRHRVAANEIWFGAWTPTSDPERPCTPDVEPDPATQPYLFTATHKFCRVTGEDPASAFRINAVYVQAQRAGTVGGPGGGAIPVVLSPFQGGNETMSRDASAIAVSGGPTMSNRLCIPMVIGVGCLADEGGGFPCDPDDPPDTLGELYSLGLSSTAVRSAGWSVFSDVNPSDNAICNYLKAGCQEFSIGDQVLVDIGQGNKYNGGCAGDWEKKVCDWFKQFVGTLQEIPLISKSGSLAEPCPSDVLGGDYVGNAYIVGFTTVKVLAVNCATHYPDDCVQAPGTTYCTDESSLPAAEFASNKWALTQHVCNHDSGTRSTGGSWSGTSPLKPVLVK